MRATNQHNTVLQSVHYRAKVAAEGNAVCGCVLAKCSQKLKSKMKAGRQWDVLMNYTAFQAAKSVRHNADNSPLGLLSLKQILQADVQPEDCHRF